MQITLGLRKTTHVVHETVTVDVVVTHDGSGSVRVPDPFHCDSNAPEYTLIGPAFPRGLTFSFASAGRASPLPAGTPQPMVDLAPGEVLESDIPLTDWIDVREPGRYELTARFETPAGTVTSAPVSFEIVAAQLVSLGLGLNVGVAGVPTIWTGWIAEASAGRILGDAVFQERRPDLGEITRHSMQAVSTVGSNATDVLVPQTNYDRMDRLTFWRVWMEGTTLHAHLAGDAAPRQLDLRPGARLIRPAVLDGHGVLDVFAIAAEPEPRIVCARFVPDAAPTLLEGAALHVQFLAGCAALGPSAAGDARHLALTTVAPDGELLLHHVGGTAVAPVSASATTIRLGRLQLLAGSQPTLRVHASGRADVALLAMTDATTRTFALVQAAFATHEAPTPRIETIGSLPRREEAAALAFSSSPGESDVVAWAVLLEGSELVTSASPDRTQPFPFSATDPMSLVASTHAAYVLADHPSEGPLFHLLR
jgi:hypothetical protein